MTKTRYEVVPDGDQWVVREGKKSTPPLDSKELAVAAAMRRAQEDVPSEVVVQLPDGSIEQEQSFGEG